MVELTTYCGVIEVELTLGCSCEYAAAVGTGDLWGAQLLQTAQRAICLGLSGRNQ
jgi:hypothetical protein